MDRRALLAFVGAVLIGGGNFVAVRFSNEELPPLFGAALRFTVAAVILFVIAWMRGIPPARGRAALGAAVYGLLGFGLAYAFLYYALVELAAGTTSVILASVPLLTLALAVLHRQERLSSQGIAGGILAIIGIAILSARTIGGDASPSHFVAALLGAIAVAESSVVAKGLPRLDPIMTNAIGMTAGATLLAITSFAFGEEWALPATGRTWLVLGYLVLFGSVLMFVLFLYVIERWTASATVYALALMPVVAVALGSFLAQEQLTWELILGGLLVGSAVWVGTLSRRRRGASVGEAPRAAGHS